MWTQRNPDYVRNCVCNIETNNFKSTFVTKVSFFGTYHWGRWSQAPPSSPPGRWEWTSVWAGPHLSWCPPTDRGWAQRRPCVRRTLRKAAWWSPPWCPGRCWTRWSCVNDWRSFHGFLQHPSKRGPIGRDGNDAGGDIWHRDDRNGENEKKQEEGRVGRSCEGT